MRRLTARRRHDTTSTKPLELTVKRWRWPTSSGCGRWPRACRLGMGFLYRNAGRREHACRELGAARKRLASMGMDSWLAHVERAVVELATVVLSRSR